MRLYNDKFNRTQVVFDGSHLNAADPMERVETSSERCRLMLINNRGGIRPYWGARPLISWKCDVWVFANPFIA